LFIQARGIKSNALGCLVNRPNSYCLNPLVTNPRLLITACSRKLYSTPRS
jgi:hypothetical protein